ncbi:MAG: HD domain-containing protein [Candidatus Eisenbacteria bacterium]|uniref:HD domain-containing protein n=1 Tax=Eiseniibacteriota bacterium TaxID=2212470 RepID=A0A7Y2E988_UNCEI|nr:HD domain-containing protein [Candidatus Eisenbacteria bacterium]
MSSPKGSSETKSLRVLVVAADAAWSNGLVSALARVGFDSRLVMAVESVTLATVHHRPAAIVIDSEFVQIKGYKLMESLRTIVPDTPIIVSVPSEQTQERLKAMLMGADDALIRPITDQESVLRIRRAMEQRSGIKRLSSENKKTKAQASGIKEELSGLRGQLLRNMAMLQRGVDFHQRLEPGLGLQPLLKSSLRNLSQQIGIHRMAFLGKAHADASWFTALASWGLPTSLEEGLRAQARGEFASLLESTAAPAILDRLGSVPGLRLELGIFSTCGFTAIIPVLNQGRLVGMVLLGESRSGGAPDKDTLALAHFLMTAFVPAINAQQLREKEAHMSTQALGVLVSALEARDPYLRGHSLRVAQIAEDLGKRHGFSGYELSMLNVAAIIHDVGRFEVDAELWSKPEPLSESDWKLIERHPIHGERLAAEADWPPQVLEAIRSHHERWDGSGYPNGLKGEEIPIGARILAIADTFEALTSARPQREALSPAEAMEVIRAEAGTKFDPALIFTFAWDENALLVS